MSSVMRAGTEQMEQAIGRQVRGLRLAANLSQDTLAANANVSLSSLRSLEQGGGSTLATLIKVLRALDALEWLTTLHQEPSVSPIALLKAQKKQQQRVRPSKG